MKSNLERVPIPLRITHREKAKAAIREVVEPTEIHPAQIIERSIEPVERSVELPPNFDPADDKWNDGKFEEWIEEVGHDEKLTEEERHVYTLYGQREAEIILRLIEEATQEPTREEIVDEVLAEYAARNPDPALLRREDGVDWQAAEQQSKNAQDQLDENAAFVRTKPFRELMKQKEEERQEQPIGGFLYRLGQSSWLRKGLVLLAPLFAFRPASAAQMESQAKQGARPAAVRHLKGYGVEAEGKNMARMEQFGASGAEVLRLMASNLYKGEARPEYHEVVEQLEAFVPMEHAPDFEPPETADTVYATEILDQIQDAINRAVDAQDPRVHVVLKGLSNLKYNFLRPRLEAKNRELAGKRAEIVKKAIATRLSKLFPNVTFTFEIDDSDPYTTLDGERLTHREAREQLKQILRLKTDRELWRLLERYEDGDISGLTADQLSALKQTIDQGRGVSAEIMVRTMR